MIARDVSFLARLMDGSGQEEQLGGLSPILRPVARRLMTAARHAHQPIWEASWRDVCTPSVDDVRASGRPLGIGGRWGIASADDIEGDRARCEPGRARARGQTDVCGGPGTATDDRLGCRSDVGGFGLVHSVDVA